MYNIHKLWVLKSHSILRGNNELPKPPVLQDFSALVHPTAIPVIQTPSASTSGHINIPTENLPDIGNISGLPTIDTPPVKGTMTIDVSQSDIKPDERVMEIDVSEASETAIDVSEVFSETVSAATSAPVPQVWDSRTKVFLLRSELTLIVIRNPR